MNYNAPESRPNSNGAISSNKSSITRWADLFPKGENQKPTTIVAENYKSNVTKTQSPPANPQRPQKQVQLTNGKLKVGGLAGNITI